MVSTRRKRFSSDISISKRPKQDENNTNNIIIRNIDSIEDLIELGKSYDPDNPRQSNINIEVVYNMLEPLVDLSNLVGMKEVKQSVLNQVIYFLQNFHDGNLDMLHTVIQGPPGVGKTELGRILGRLYVNMGVLTRDTFIAVKRSDLIAKYLGQTADKTQKVINKALGGVLFIDEAYSLGDNESRDSYSKECLDTLNQNLTEYKANFMCIIAGYEEDLERCFFSFNPGLRRRFTFRYTISGYSPEELKEILIRKITSENWFIENPLENSLPTSFFQSNKDSFKNYGGDMEVLFLNIKLAHSRRVFNLSNEAKKYITLDDLNKGFQLYLNNTQKIKKVENTSYLQMYL